MERTAFYDRYDRSKPKGYCDGEFMSQTKVSSKYQVVIPKDVRTSASVRVGQKFQVIVRGDIITLVPDRPISSMRGFVRGIRTNGFREKKDRM